MAHRTAAQKRATARLVAMNKARSANPARRARKHNPRRARKHNPRRRNPVAAPTVYATRARNPRHRRRNPRRSNPVMHFRRRHRNPIGGAMGSSIVSLLKTAAEQAGGALVMDMAFGQVKKFLPTSLQRTPGTIGVGDAVKAAFTAIVGRMLAKPTRGLSLKAAQGSLTVQMYGMVSTMLPTSLPLGYASAGRVVQGQNRIGPVMRQTMGGVGRYTSPATPTPLLGRYVDSGSPSPLLTYQQTNRRASVMAREGVSVR